jgi:hypothetical protein
MKKFPALERRFSALFNNLDNTEMPPTMTTENAVKTAQNELSKSLIK